MPFLLLLFLLLPVAAATPCNVRDFGATGDGTTLDTAALQAAIDACAERGGGTVLFPPGHYLSGTLFLRSHLTLHLEGGALLQGSANPADYPVVPSFYAFEGTTATWADGSDDETERLQRSRHFLVAENVENLALTGTGTIDGQGPRFWTPENRFIPERKLWWLRLSGVRGLTLRDLTFTNSPGWTLVIENSQDVLIDGIRIVNPQLGPNTDGIDLRGGRDIRIANVFIETGDDAICLKTWPGQPLENVTISNSVLQSDDSAIKLGTSTYADMRRISVSNVVIRNSRKGIAFFLKDGATLEHVSFDNVTMELTSRHNTEYAVFVDADRRYEHSPMGRIRHITFRNLAVTTRGNTLISGHPDGRIEHLTMDGVRILTTSTVDLTRLRKARGTIEVPLPPNTVDLASRNAHLTIGYADQVRLRDVVVVEQAADGFQQRHGLHLEHVRDVSLDGVEFQRQPGNRLREVQQIAVERLRRR